MTIFYSNFISFELLFIGSRSGPCQKFLDWCELNFCFPNTNEVAKAVTHPDSVKNTLPLKKKHFLLFSAIPVNFKGQWAFFKINWNPSCLGEQWFPKSKEPFGVVQFLKPTESGEKKLLQELLWYEWMLFRKRKSNTSNF